MHNTSPFRSAAGQEAHDDPSAPVRSGLSYTYPHLEKVFHWVGLYKTFMVMRMVIYRRSIGSIDIKKLMC